MASGVAATEGPTLPKHPRIRKMDDKDRLGDKLHDKGKAAEDIFIAEQERKRLERRRQAEAAARVAGACPKDGSKLVAQTEHGLTIDVCPTCSGIWLDKQEVALAMRHDNEIAVIQWVRSLLGR